MWVAFTWHNVYHKHNFANVESTIFRFKKKKVIEKFGFIR